MNKLDEQYWITVVNYHNTNKYQTIGMDRDNNPFPDTLLRGAFHWYLYQYDSGEPEYNKLLKIIKDKTDNANYELDFKNMKFLPVSYPRNGIKYPYNTKTYTIDELFPGKKRAFLDNPVTKKTINHPTKQNIELSGSEATPTISHSRPASASRRSHKNTASYRNRVERSPDDAPIIDDRYSVVRHLNLGGRKKGGKSRKSSRNPKNKTVKKGVSNEVKSRIVRVFLSILVLVKLFHWKTKSYAQHKATDDLYKKLNEDIDVFIETLLGKDESRIRMLDKKLPIFDEDNTEDFKQRVYDYREFLTTWMNMFFDEKKDSDLLSLRDNILVDVNQFLYLMTFYK